MERQTNHELIADLCRHLLSTVPAPQLHRVTVLFPNRRAGLVFRHTLAQQAGKALWAPQVDTLSAWMQQLHPAPIAHTLELLELLWEASGRTEPLASFSPLGLQLLSDFFDIDAGLADPASAFALNLPDIPAEEVTRTLGSPLAQHYADLLTQAATLYQHLHSALSRQGKVSEGGLLRDLGTRPQDFLPEQLPEQIWLVGFDGLHAAEAAFLAHLTTLGCLHTAWDVDAWYMQPRAEGLAPRQAGSTISRLWHQWPGLRPQGAAASRLSTQTTQVHLHLLPHVQNQLMALSLTLQAQLEALAHTYPDATERDAHLRRIAVVLPDEAVLVPLLEHLPPALQRCNITMGYPAQHTLLYQLLHSWHQLQEEYVPEEGYYHKQVAAVLGHPLVRNFRPQLYQDIYLQQLRPGNVRYWQCPPALLQDSLTGTLFSWTVDAEAVLRQLYQLYDWCHELAREQGELRDAFHREFLNLWHTKLHQLEALVAQQPELSAADVRALLLQLLERQRIPFAGEPLGGVQIMGLLETRALQFDTVYVLSMNEGQMPRSSRPDGTLLPGVRQLLGLPGPEALEAQYSYLFWRLLQGVPTAHLFSTGEANETGGGEPSRFIRQIEMDWCLDNPHVQVQHHRWQEAQLVRHSLILRPQVADVALALSNGATDEAGHPLIKMSPTALSTYLKCPLRFWFRYVQHLLPPEELTEDPDAKQFGSLVHKTLELLYAPFVGQTVEGTDLHRLMQPDTLEQALAQALEAELQQLGSADFGKMILLKEVAREMVLGTLRQDAERVPFGIEALEAFLTHRVQLPLPDGGSVTLQLNGFADRIDSLPEGVVIWDYKTGSVQAKDLKLEAPETLLKGELRGSKSPAMALQMLLYGWLWWRKTGAQPLDAGILAVRQVPAAAHALPLSFSTATLEATDQLLRDLMAEILAPNRTFDPTEDLATCTYCDYRQICQRG